ncbi:hypothetical protein G7K_2009-t1 [Saitoella complicata NRRL Y-17804]|uniref:Structural maintenance of chromosomes protein 5 n=1 Tax=Saitoella complicata (strain BCRC 22490 / CBS 7301 / JCM 7358 / NBRC 10748 / NRRL Y-17804) TaxID=698492 RepID=A0A0E9NDK1_SAICN|nr:hypothetical protein G7K_2009-t1 [Saitoella complicata NRRL Y-17804]
MPRRLRDDEDDGSEVEDSVTPEFSGDVPDDTASTTPLPVRKRQRMSNVAECNSQDDKYLPGSIVRVTLDHFLTYDQTEFRPGPNLNMIIGPNGTGKSTIVCAICLGLGYAPSYLGRAKDVSEFVKHGYSEAEIEIELQGQEGQQNTIIKRRLHKDNNSSQYWMNGVSTSFKLIQDYVRKFNVQIDNLCQFLPQDKVVEFAQLTPEKLLQETQRAAGDENMLKQHQELISLRNEQKGLSSGKEKDDAALANLKTRQAVLERDVQRFRDREAIKKRIELLEIKVPFAEYNDAKRAFEEARADNREQAAELQRIKTRFEPMVQAREEAKEHSQRMEEERTKRKQRYDTVQQAMVRVSQDLDRTSSAMEDHRRDIVTRRKQEQTRKEKLREVRSDVAKWQRNLGPEPENPDASDLNGQIREKSDALRVLNHQVKEVQDKQQALTDRGREEGTRLRRLQEEHGRLNSVREQRLELLKGWHRDTYEAVQWLRQNKDKFEHEVYEPVYLEVSVSNMRYANQIEMGFRDSNFLSFTCMSRQDYRKFTELLVDNNQAAGRRLSLFVAEYSGTNAPTLESQRSPVPQEELKRLGFDGWMLDYLEGPKPVLNALCHMVNANSTALSFQPFSSEDNKKVEALTRQNEQGDIIQLIQNYMAGRVHYTINRSRYGRKEASTRTRNVRNAKRFGEAVNMEKKSQLERNMNEIKSNIDEVQSGLDQCKKKEIKIRADYEVLKAERDAIEKEKNERIKANREWQKRQVRLNSMKEDLERREAVPVTYEEDIAQIKARMARSAEERGQLAVQYKDLVVQAMQLMTRYQVAYLNALQAVSDNKGVIARFGEISQQLQEAENASTAVKALMADKKRLAQQKYQTATAKSQQVSEETREQLQASLEDLETVEELRDIIMQEKNNLELIFNTNSNVIEQYEKRQRDIAELQEKVETRQAALDEVDTKIEQIRGDWEPRLRALVERISRSFSDAFNYIGCAGEVQVGRKDPERTPEDDFAQWRIEILVKFRDTEKLQLLDAQRQSGGERSVSTIMYLMALQDMATAPFRVVDEINQGMDPRNERLVHARLVDVACRGNTSQYFLITPKLLPDLMYHSKMKVLTIYNGEWLPEPEESKMDFKKYLAIKKAQKGLA